MESSFLIWELDRGTIADMVNSELNKGSAPFTTDDPRLTDQFCEELVNLISEGLGSIDGVVDLQHNSVCRLMKKHNIT